jgi:hypothetical protein
MLSNAKNASLFAALIAAPLAACASSPPPAATVSVPRASASAPAPAASSISRASPAPTISALVEPRCVPQHPGDEAACAAKGPTFHFGPGLSCSGVQGAESRDEPKPCVCYSNKDIEDCASRN